MCQQTTSITPILEKFPFEMINEQPLNECNRYSFKNDSINCHLRAKSETPTIYTSFHSTSNAPVKLKLKLLRKKLLNYPILKKIILKNLEKSKFFCINIFE